MAILRYNPCNLLMEYETEISCFSVSKDKRFTSNSSGLRLIII